MEVIVRNNNVGKAYRILKKKLQKDGLFRDLRLKNYYEKPSARRRREKKESINRVAKVKRLKAQKEGY
jgi:small subunit ribosomal protein S21|tara:strand:+ start:856 stop:1059 length:204 start_codon:yes stop_codon:yes gene_type:complete